MARTTSSKVATPGASIFAVPGRSTVLSLIISIRPGQWTKNLLVFAGLLFGLRLFDPAAVINATLAFVVFCGLSGAVYLINDVLDRESDRRHPLKARRPIASGTVSVPLAIGTAAVLGVAGLGAAFAINGRLGIVSAALPRAPRAVFGRIEAHRHHRRADDCRRVRAEGDRRGGGDRRGDQPLAAGVHDPGRAVHCPGETAA